VYKDLVGRTSYLGLIAFALTGRRLSATEEHMLDDLAASSHVTEPRVGCGSWRSGSGASRATHDGSR
jgi:hypothetical protein